MTETENGGEDDSNDGSQRKVPHPAKFELEGIDPTCGGTIWASIEPYVGQPFTGWSAVRSPPICDRRGKIR